LTAPRPPLQ